MIALPLTLVVQNNSHLSLTVTITDWLQHKKVRGHVLQQLQLLIGYNIKCKGTRFAAATITK